MKQFLCVVLALACTLCLSGCASMEYIGETLFWEDTIQEAKNRLYFGFSNGSLFDDSQEMYLTEDDLKDYRAPSSAYHSSVLFEQLSENDQWIYRALEYAMENGYTNILFESQLVESEESLITVLDYMALDSPLLEQNLRFATGTFSTHFPLPLWGPFEKELPLEGYYVEVDNFDAAHWQKKQVALDTAKQLVAPYLTEKDKGLVAEKLYRFVAQTITYDDGLYSDTDAVHPYLYDALITGVTNCDGFANALSLLYNLAGIPCVEKMYEQTDGYPGHTWNMFCVNDQWYNADATTSETIPTVDCTMHAGMFFGFEDCLENAIPMYSLWYPFAFDGLYMSVDAHVESPYDAYDAVMQAFEKHNNEWALVVFSDYDAEAMSALLQDIANAQQRRVSSHIHYSKSDTVVCICDGALFE